MSTQQRLTSRAVVWVTSAAILLAPVNAIAAPEFTKAKPAFATGELLGQSIDEATVRRVLGYCAPGSYGLVQADEAVNSGIRRLTGRTPADPFQCAIAVNNQISLDYAMRAQDRQAQSDVVSTVAAISTSALLLGHGKMSDHTQDWWTAGSVLPILQEDIRAVSPRAMLYRSASSATMRVSQKYVDLRYALERFTSAPLPNLSKVQEACARLDGWARALEPAGSQLEGELVLSDLRLRQSACRAQEAAIVQLQALKGSWSKSCSADFRCIVDIDRLATLAVNDASALVHKVSVLDASTKADPFTAVRTAIAAPIRKMGDIIAGQDGNSFAGRADPLDGKFYALTLTSGAASGDLTAKLTAQSRPADTVFMALRTLQADVKTAGKIDPNKVPIAGAAGRMNSDPSNSLEATRNELQIVAIEINNAISVAARVQAADAPLVFDLDPRKAVLDPQWVATQAAARREAEATAAAKAAEAAKPADTPAEPVTPSAPTATPAEGT